MAAKRLFGIVFLFSTMLSIPKYPAIAEPADSASEERSALERFEEALAAKDAETVSRLFGGELSPAHYDSAHDTHLWKLVVMTGDEKFVLPVLQAIDRQYGFPIQYGGDNYENPLLACIETKNVELVRAVAAWRPKLIGETSYFYRTGESVKPFTRAVEIGSIEICRALLDHGAKAENWEFAYTTGTYEVGQEYNPNEKYLPTYRVPSNSYSFAKSAEMRTFLESLRVKTILPPVDAEGYASRGICLEDRVRVRSTPDLSGQTLGHLAKDENVEVTALTAADFEIGGRYFRWYRVKTSGGMEGWAYGQFIHVGSWTGP